ncbi:MAG: DUF262 domain-containing HNH endonuclease family protein [Pseudanabaena sp. CAN_BIN31]|nr:DUF262 domain-containing HNH endonuclease family protein [Pseudanabaena sp. CAN_BIN31]
MEKPKSLDSLFKEKIFRIPDYQRGYAWQKEQLKAFWEDLINLSSDRSHYTGVLTLKQIPDGDIAEDSKEFWLLDNQSYHVYQVVDGLQRLTTFIIFLQALVDVIKTLPENNGKADDSIFVNTFVKLSDLQTRYLFKEPPDNEFRTYLFGYEEDNPSDKYFKCNILDEPNAGLVEETFYTLNLSNAKTYFTKQLQELYKPEKPQPLQGIEALQDIYKKLTKQFLFNEYVIENEFDVFVAFETMNNRGKSLSNLELLKNRLIYLTTLYSDIELKAAPRKHYRDSINEAWKEIYRQLGRNKTNPLNDDDFLRAHWIMTFPYSQRGGQDYIRFLLDKKFTPQNVHKKVECVVLLETPQEIRSEQEQGIGEVEDDNGSADIDTITGLSAQLKPKEILDYVDSLKVSSVHWFNSFFPELSTEISSDEKQWLDRLNRVGIAYFRPLIVAILKNESNKDERIRIFKEIERFIFVMFRMNSEKSNYGSSEFYRAASRINRDKAPLNEIITKLQNRFASTLNNDNTFRTDDFYNSLSKKFKDGSGYYGWSGLRYFLYEYEIKIAGTQHPKVTWKNFLKSEKDKISIEHVYPQTTTKDWNDAFNDVNQEQRRFYKATLGNLLLPHSLKFGAS